VAGGKRGHRRDDARPASLGGERRWLTRACMTAGTERTRGRESRAAASTARFPRRVTARASGSRPDGATRSASSTRRTSPERSTPAMPWRPSRSTCGGEATPTHAPAGCCSATAASSGGRPRSAGPRPRPRSRRTCAAMSTPPSGIGRWGPSARPRSRRGSVASNGTWPRQPSESSTHSWPASSAPRYGTGSSLPRHAWTSGSRSRSPSGSSRWRPRRWRPSLRR
jgi:hypothetical protein